MQNESKTVDVQHPIRQATDSLKKEKDGYEEINPEPAKRKLQSTVMLQKFAWKNKDIMTIALQTNLPWDRSN